MPDEGIKVERHPNYLTITLNRPEKRNALNQSMLNALDRTFSEVEADKEIRTVMLRGEGQSFCSGIDLREIREMGGSGVTFEQVLHRIETLPVPVIAAIHGATLTGGLVLTLACDLRIATESARLGMTPARIGYLPSYAIFRRFVEIVGPAATAEIMYLADPLDGTRARDIGLVHRVVPDGKLEQAGTEWAEKIAGNAPLSVRAMKTAIKRVISTAFEVEHADIDEMGNRVRSSNDAKEGIRAFLEKRKPVWRAE